ncbi:YqhA family protein [Roseomonas sp. HF4]|uniref:YqhA family protein n=1 Tax=Roseomonas sp. HF4 TaxID=2562313 RepID=UPI0010C06F01|nr:YqhA family protein [Roseomonas sp. HF4]
MRPILARLILANRWIAAVFLLGLTVALGLFAVRYLAKVWKFATTLFTSPEDQALLDLLHILDWTLVAALVVMVILASWDSLVAPFDPESKASGMAWIRKLDPGNLKVKLAGSIVAISSIQLLQMFLRADAYSDRTLAWALGLHMVFLLGALMLALTDRIGSGSRAAKE